MSLPGLGLTAPTVSKCAEMYFVYQVLLIFIKQKAASAPIPIITTSVHTVERGSEWRFEVAIGTEITVRVC